jgi:hypothetical protein
VEVPIMPRRVLVFRPSQMLRDAVNAPAGTRPQAAEGGQKMAER